MRADRLPDERRPDYFRSGFVVDEEPIYGDVELVDVDPSRLDQPHLALNAVPDDLWD